MKNKLLVILVYFSKENIRKIGPHKVHDGTCSPLTLTVPACWPNPSQSKKARA